MKIDTFTKHSTTNDAAEIRNQIIQNRERMKQADNLRSILLEVVREKFEGKKISKRIANKFEERLPEGYVVHYSTQFGMFNIRVWGNGITMDGRLSFFLGYDSDPIISSEFIEKRNGGYSAAAETEVPELSLIEDVLDRRNRLIDELKELDRIAGENSFRHMI